MLLLAMRSSPRPVTSITALLFTWSFNLNARKEAPMLLSDNNTATTLVCAICGGPILPDQPFIERGHRPMHSESADCNPEEGWNPHMETE